MSKTHLGQQVFSGAGVPARHGRERGKRKGGGHARPTIKLDLTRSGSAVYRQSPSMGEGVLRCAGRQGNFYLRVMREPCRTKVQFRSNGKALCLV